jgi:hypothetical protein
VDAHEESARLSIFLFVFFVLAELRFNLASGNTVPLFGPGAEIDQLTTIRAKRSVWIIVPRTFFAASGAFHTQSHAFLLDY